MLSLTLFYVCSGSFALFCVRLRCDANVCCLSLVRELSSPLWISCAQCNSLGSRRRQFSVYYMNRTKCHVFHNSEIWSKNHIGDVGFDVAVASSTRRWQDEITKMFLLLHESWVVLHQLRFDFRSALEREKLNDTRHTIIYWILTTS